MKRRAAMVLALLLAMVGCKTTTSDTQCATIQMDSLLLNPESYVEKRVAVEGAVVHVCPVLGAKLKLRSDNGGIIKVVSANDSVRFEKSLNHKRVVVTGIVEISRLSTAYIDSLASQNIILCHIDNTPCTDSAWVDARKKEGVAAQLAKEQAAGLRKKMKEQNESQLRVVTIVAESVMEVEKR